MHTAWLTYAWKDNEGPSKGDIDYIIQEIERFGVSIRVDKRDLVVGKQLWPQIEEHISDESMCDAWIYVVTSTSLTSKACREELLYALDRALDKRKEEFPIIGIFKGDIPEDLPRSLAIRLCVSTDEPNWAQRVAAGAKGEKVAIKKEHVQPFNAHLCNYGQVQIFEVRPRLGSWSPFCFGVEIEDASRVISVHYSPSTGEPYTKCQEGHRSGSISSPLPDWEENGWVWKGAAYPSLTTSMAAHIRLSLGGRPLTIRFGPRGGVLYSVTLTE